MKITVPPRPGRSDALATRNSARIAKPRLTREQQRLRRRQELLDAAWILFCEKGYEAVTIDDVADHAGCSRQPVYWLFGDKQKLFFELQREAIAATVEVLQTLVPSGATLRDNLKRFARFVSEQLNAEKPKHGERLYFVTQAIALSRPDIAEQMQVEARKVLNALADCIATSTLAPGERLRGKPVAVAAHLIALVNGMTAVQFQTGDRYTNERDLTEIFNEISISTASVTARTTRLRK